MGIFEGITHSEEIIELLNEAQNLYDNGERRLESQKKATTKSLEKLGKEKIHSWSKDMSKFLDSFGSFSNVQMVSKMDENYDFLGKYETPNELMVNMRNASYNADEIIKAGALSLGTGALVGIATYGGVAMFANASTGTAIATLRGVAKKNATLAWLGGGSIATGGIGMAGGTVALGGVVVGAIALAGGVIASAKGRAKLAEARSVYAEAESAVSQMNVVITGMQGIEKVSDNYRSFISKLSSLFRPYLEEMDNIASRYQRGSDGKVDYDDLSEIEQKTLHLSWLLAQLYYHILSVPILNDQGEIEPSSRLLLQKAEKEYSQLTNQKTQLEKEKKKIKSLLSDAKKTYSKASQAYYKKKQSTSELLVGIGKRRIELWDKTFSPFMCTLSNFEDISVSNTFSYNITDIPIEFIFESSDSVLSFIKRLNERGTESLGNTGLVEVALFGGEDFLGELSHVDNEDNAIQNVHRHSMSLWFTGELDPAISDNTTFGEVSDYYISAVKQTVDGISGRESLSEAKAINKETKELSSKIKNAIRDFDKTNNKIKKIDRALRKYNKTQEKILQKIDEIRERHQTNDAAVQYDVLSDTEKRIFEMSFMIAKIQYTILASCILTQSNGGDIDDADIVIDTANTAYNRAMRDVFKTTNEGDKVVSDIMWQENAERAKYVGFVTSAACIVLMIVQLITKNLIGVIGFGGMILAFPVFFYFKNFNQSKLFMWRCIRIAAAIVVVMVAEIIRLVV